MSGGKAQIGIRVEYMRSWEPFFRKPMNWGPIEPMLLASPVERPPPEPSHPFAKCSQALHVARNRMIVEETLSDRFEPLARLLDRFVHTSAELPFDFLQFGPHAFADGLAFQGKFPLPVLPANMG